MAARLLCSILVVVTLVGCVKSGTRNIAQSTLTIAGQTLSITKAVTAAEQTKGLGGVPALAWDEAMLFVFEGYEEHTFWMKGMLIPIDIIWLHNDTVVGFETNVPPPIDVSTAPDSSLPTYQSPQPVNYVLEVRAGFVDRFNVTVGARIVLTES